MEKNEPHVENLQKILMTQLCGIQLPRGAAYPLKTTDLETTRPQDALKPRLLLLSLPARKVKGRDVSACVVKNAAFRPSLRDEANDDQQDISYTNECWQSCRERSISKRPSLHPHKSHGTSGWRLGDVDTGLRQDNMAARQDKWRSTSPASMLVVLI